MIRIPEKYPTLVIKRPKFSDQGTYEEVRDFVLSVDRFRSDVVKAINSLDDYRTSAGTPVGSLTPQFIGEEVLDTTASPKKWYKSVGLANTDWVALS